ncbi:CYTH domain-containing protein [Bifidobacterium mongoliense]|uniref:CYTH domain-containing protein n=1 Tax=Bifidobacterium mongoliense TaxID=518643 RepID=UPI0030EED67C
MDNPMNDFEYERRFFCSQMPDELDDGDAPTLIIQSYYVHADNYALRIRLQSNSVRIPVDADTDPMAVLSEYRDSFTQAFVTIKGPSVGGTRYEAEREVDPHIAGELIRRGGVPIIKNRFSAWLGEDGWSIDVFGGDNAPLIVAEAERSSPVTNLVIPNFCITEITDQARFSNDGLASHPFSQWSEAFSHQLAVEGTHFEQVFGRNRHE